MKFTLLSLSIASCLLVPAVASAQAWTSDAGTLSLEGTYQLGYGTESENVKVDVLHQYLIPEVAYAITDSLAISASLPLIAVKVDSPEMTRHGEWDDGSFHASPTDFRLNAQYEIPISFVSVTPLIGGSLPVADYEVRGMGAGGRHLKAAHLGVDVGVDLDSVIPRSLVHLSYELTLAEKFTEAGPEGEKFSQNYTRLGLLIGHYVGGFQLHAGADYHRNHGGFGFDDFPRITMEQRMYHDALLLERTLLVGGGVGYQVGDSVSLSASVRIFADGKNTHNSSIFALGASWDYAL